MSDAPDKLMLTDGGYVNTACVVYAGGWGSTISEMVGVNAGALVPLSRRRLPPPALVRRAAPDHARSRQRRGDVTDGPRQHAHRPARRGDGGRSPARFGRPASINRAHRSTRRSCAAVIRRWQPRPSAPPGPPRTMSRRIGTR